MEDQFPGGAVPGLRIGIALDQAVVPVSLETGEAFRFPSRPADDHFPDGSVLAEAEDQPLGRLGEKGLAGPHGLDRALAWAGVGGDDFHPCADRVAVGGGGGASQFQGEEVVAGGVIVAHEAQLGSVAV